MAPFSGNLKTGWHQYKPFLLVFGALGFVNVAVQFTDLWAARNFGQVIDEVASWRGAATWHLTPRVLVLVSEVIAATLVGLVLRNLVKIWSAKRIEFDLPTHVGLYAWRRLLALSGGRHDMQQSGVMSIVGHRGQRATSALAILVVQNLFYVALRIVITTSAILYFYPQCGVAVVLGIVGFSASIWYINARFKADITLAQEATRFSESLEGDIARNIGIVQLNAQEAKVEAELATAFRRQADFAKSVYTRFHLWNVTPGATPTIGKLCILGIGVSLVSRGQIRPGELVVCIGWASDVLDHLHWMHDINQSFMDQVISLKSYLQLLDSASVAPDAGYAVPRSSFEGHIEFRNISFEYPNINEQGDIDQSAHSSRTRPRQWAIRNVSFTVAPGEQLAIIGPSGAGKSTLFKLLLGIYDPDEGQILLDGLDIRIAGVTQLRQAIGVVEQNVALLNRSMRDNILFGLSTPDSIDEEWLSEVLRISRLESVTDKLPAGLDTCLGQNGAILSGGERQRVGIARALAKKPTILLFDEAMSQLDGENASLVAESIRESCCGRTVVTIAHQLRSFINADRILILNSGSVVAEGDHENLLRTSEWYRALAESTSRPLPSAADEFKITSGNLPSFTKYLN